MDLTREEMDRLDEYGTFSETLCEEIASLPSKDGWECYTCPDYNTEICAVCPHPTLEELPTPAEIDVPDGIYPDPNAEEIPF